MVWFPVYNQPMSNHFQDRLRRLGVAKGTKHLKSTPQGRSLHVPPLTHSTRTPQSILQLLPGAQLHQTAVGDCVVVDKVYPLTHQHGHDRLADLLGYAPQTAVPYTSEPALANCDFTDALFLDTETTGLAGAGVMAFMVGVAFFERVQSREGDRLVLVVRQYFLRDHGDEPAMLRLLEVLMANKTMLISFNGRSFDIPLLDRRYLLNRQPTPFFEMPHLDLMHPARRIWYQRLGKYSLITLEKELLGVSRTQDDVPGSQIPLMYHDYLRTGDATPLHGVFYHNHQDMLSMVTLASRLLALFTQTAPPVAPQDLLCLGRWQADIKQTELAEQTLKRCVQLDLPLDQYHQALHRLGLLYKQTDRRPLAVPIWQQIAATSFDDVGAHVELAKFFEWHAGQPDKALHWTEQALGLVATWSNRAIARLTADELRHRRQRLEQKINGRLARD